MSHWLSRVCEHHKEWIKIAKVYGCGDYSEDLVQEVYIKLHKYASERKVFTNGNINKGYVFFAIRNAAKTYHKKKMKRCDNQTLSESDEQEEDETSVDKEAWERFCEKVEDSSLEWKWSDKQIFDEYRLTKTSMRKLGAKYNISWVSIFTTIKNCKTKLKDELHEDYKNYQEGNYEEIKSNKDTSERKRDRDEDCNLNGKDRDKKVGTLDGWGGLRMRGTGTKTKQPRISMAAFKGQVPGGTRIQLAKQLPKTPTKQSNIPGTKKAG